jgi:hypothetical protein
MRHKRMRARDDMAGDNIFTEGQNKEFAPMKQE